MPYSTAVLNVVGLSSSLIGEATPRITAFAAGGQTRRLIPALPAVTCSVQSSMLTGLAPREHGIVGNGWYDRTLCEVQFWKQSNHLVVGEKVWETARRRDSSITCANLFWWFNMYSSADFSVTPRPQYRVDGRKIPDCYTHPADLRDVLQAELGRFPLFQFWGPGASIASSRWIADASRIVWNRHHPTLTLIYLPHLDYALQKLGPAHPSITEELRSIDDVVGGLLDFFDERRVRVILLSEYGIEPVREAVHINRTLRSAGALTVREEGGRELLDCGASAAFAVADHQVAHLYVARPERIDHVSSICRELDGVDRVMNRQEQAAVGLDHERSGDLVLVAQPGRWFSYDYWLDDRRAPDFARTVEIHKKPGYDPLELFIDPAIRWPKVRIAAKLFRKAMGFRTLMDVIPLDTSLLRGSHGRTDQEPPYRPVLLTRHAMVTADDLPCSAVRDVILQHMFDLGDDESSHRAPVHSM
jgi:predicted AlkP superfamily pyrophosphatase or phosphodiesterase